MAVDEREYAKKRAEARQQSSWFKLKEGDNQFRILPVPPKGNAKFNFFEYAVHRDVGPKKQTVRCGVDPTTGEGECWLCDVKIPALKKKNMESRAAALASKAQLLMQVAKVSEDGQMTGPFLFTPAKGVGDQLLASIFGSRKRSYVDPVKGFNLGLSRTGTGKNDTRYGIIEPDQESSKVPKTLLAKVLPFEDLKEVPKYSQAKQAAAYTGQDIVEDEAEEEEEERPKSRTRKPAVDEDDEEDVDAAEESDDIEDDDSDVDDDEEGVPDDDEEDEEEDEAPAPKKPKPGAKPAHSVKPAAGKPKRKPVEDEDEDSAPDEDDDPPPPPRGKPKPVAAAGKKKPVVEEEEDIEDDPEDEIDDIDLDELEEDDTDTPDDDEEEEEAPAPKKPKPGAKPAPKPSPKPKSRR